MAGEAFFTLAYARLGTSPDGSGTYFLPRLVGLKRAAEIALLGERIGAAAALELGLVNRVVAADRLEAEGPSWRHASPRAPPTPTATLSGSWAARA